MNRLHLVVLLLAAAFLFAADAPKDVAAARNKAPAKLQAPEPRSTRDLSTS